MGTEKGRGHKRKPRNGGARAEPKKKSNEITGRRGQEENKKKKKRNEKKTEPTRKRNEKPKKSFRSRTSEADSAPSISEGELRPRSMANESKKIIINETQRIRGAQRTFRGLVSPKMAKEDRVCWVFFPTQVRRDIHIRENNSFMNDPCSPAVIELYIYFF